jgi:hypothetical protein
MTSDEVQQSIRTWCSTDDDLSLVGEGSDPAAEFVLTITAGALSASPVNLEAVKGSGADRLTLRHRSRSTADPGAVAKLVQSRPGWVSVSDDRSEGATVQTFVYLDGLTKHAFVQAASELARTARLLGSLTQGSAETTDAAVTVPGGAGLAGAAAGGSSVSGSYTPSSAYGGQYGQQGGQPVGSPSFTPQQQPTYAPAWAPTHTVPAQGARAWAAPDPAGAVVANLAPGLPIQVTEVRGAWARVVCSNGWTGWIDGRPIGVAS